MSKQRKQRKRGKSRGAERPGKLRRWLRRFAMAALILVAVATVVPIAWLALRPPVTTSFMLTSFVSADPATGLVCERVHYRWVDWDRIASPLRRAVVVAEDQRFLEHHGFDLRQLRRAVDGRAQGKRMRGASTITQQTAKNLLLWPGRSWLRKGVEAWYTGWLELALPKQRILELYLNVAQFAPCVFGAEAGARHHFGRAAAELDEAQAALLAAVLPNPARLRASDPGPWVRERSAAIERQLRDMREPEWLRGL